MDSVESTTLSCAECGRKPRQDENAEDDWRAYSDGAGELIVFCPGCAERRQLALQERRLEPLRTKW